MSPEQPTMERQNVTLEEFFNAFGEILQLKWVAGHKGGHRLINEQGVNRPALALTGHFKHFAKERIQLLGSGEMGFLVDLQPEKQRNVLREIVRHAIPCFVVSNQYAPNEILIEIANEAAVPLFASGLNSRDFTIKVTHILEDLLGKHFWLHGTLVDIRGVGVLLVGESGIGKSECALTLIERGHALVADDIVDVKLVGNEVVGQSPKIGREHMECRGIGIINVVKLFGARAFQPRKHIDLVVLLKAWNPSEIEDRTGLDTNHYNLLDVSLPHIKILVRPGRDIAQIIEVAALLQALKKMGYNAAESYNQSLIGLLSKESSQKALD